MTNKFLTLVGLSLLFPALAQANGPAPRRFRAPTAPIVPAGLAPLTLKSPTLLKGRAVAIKKAASSINRKPLAHALYFTAVWEEGPNATNHKSMILEQINISHLKQYLGKMAAYKGSLTDKGKIAAAEKDIQKHQEYLKRSERKYEDAAKFFDPKDRVVQVDPTYVPGKNPEDKGTTIYKVKLGSGQDSTLTSEQLFPPAKKEAAKK